MKRTTAPAKKPSFPARAIADLIGSVDGLPADLGARKKHYLRTTGFGRKRPRSRIAKA